MFLYKTMGILICPYDDRGRLTGEEVWEPDSSKAELIQLDPADVLTTEEAALSHPGRVAPMAATPKSGILSWIRTTSGMKRTSRKHAASRAAFQCSGARNPPLGR